MVRENSLAFFSVFNVTLCFEKRGHQQYVPYCQHGYTNNCGCNLLKLQNCLSTAPKIFTTASNSSLVDSGNV